MEAGDASIIACNNQIISVMLFVRIALGLVIGYYGLLLSETDCFLVSHSRYLIYISSEMRSLQKPESRIKIKHTQERNNSLINKCFKIGEEFTSCVSFHGAEA